MRLLVFTLVLSCTLIPSCSRELQVTVLYDHSRGLKPEDRVFWNEKPIGTVQAVQVTQAGRYAVQIRIDQNFRQVVTDQSRFIIQADPQRNGPRSVALVSLAEGGRPLPNGATVEGSSSLSVWLEQSGRELEIWSERFQEEIEHWKEELLQMPMQELYVELERQIEYWTDALEKTEDDVHRYFHQEVLPRLEEAMKELEQYFKQLGSDKKVQPLEERLQTLKSI